MKLHSILLTMSFALGSCASIERVAFPQGWPLVAGAQSCDNFAGVYSNKAVSSTEWTAQRNPDWYGAYLSNLINTGAAGSPTDKVTVSAVKLDMMAMRVLWRYGGTWESRPLSLSPRWTCSEGSGLAAKFDESSDSEGTVGGRVRTLVSLQLAADRSLIAHTVVEFYGGFPAGGRGEYWTRFAREDSLAP